MGAESITLKGASGKGRMLFGILRLTLLAALWWAALWFVLPVEWLQGTTASFALVHLAPPVLVEAGWRVWAKMRGAAMGATKKQAEQEAARAAHQKKLEIRHAHVECRGGWAVVPKVPDWHGGDSAQLALMGQDTESEADTALLSPLREVLFRALLCEATAWLPVYLLPGRVTGDCSAHFDLIRQARLEALAKIYTDSKKPLPPLECAILPGSGDVVDRLIALFESDPNLPAVILIGMDTPLNEKEESDAESRPGHAVTVLLLGRPGLVAPDEAQIAYYREHEAIDPHTPFWEREQACKMDQAFLQWGKMPLPIAAAFLKAFPPVGTLHRAETIRRPAPGQKALTQQFHEAIREALIHAGLREWPLEEEKSKDEQATPVEPEPLELGWLAYNADTDGLASLLSALWDFGCEPDLFSEIGNVNKEYGGSGAARGVLMLAESLIRATQRQNPALMVNLDETDGIAIRLARPASEPFTKEVAAPDHQLGVAIHPAIED